MFIFNIGLILKKNQGFICKTDTQIRFMRVYQDTVLVNEHLRLKNTNI